jgi:hypothetical protein
LNDNRQQLAYLEKNQLSIHIEKDGVTIYESRDPMLKPLFFCLVQKREDLKGATVVDKIVGRAAALLAVLGEVEQVITPLASETAKETLAAAGVLLYTEKIIPYIINSDRTGLCPMEKLAGECRTPQELFDRLTAIIKLD